MKRHDVIVVGAGPAGISAAKVLSNAGLDVLLIDKSAFPRDKGCGGGLTPRSIKLLKRLFPDFNYPKNVVNTFEFGQIQNKSFKPFHRVRIKSDIHTVKRKDFDNLLLKEAKKYGINYSVDKINSIKVENNSFIIEGNEKYSSEYVIVACGLFGPKLLKIPDIEFEVPRFSFVYHTSKITESNIIRIGFFSDGYFWHFPQTKGSTTGMGFYNKKNNDLQMAKEILGETDKRIKTSVIPLFEAEKSFKNNNRFDGCLFVGDSAGFVDNWTGEGISFALKSGMEAASAIIKHFTKPTRINDQYLYNIRKMAKHLILADSFRKTFYGNLPVNLNLLKEKRLLKLFISYISSFSKSANYLLMKSIFVRTPDSVHYFQDTE
ncbi:MAG: FAD-dependent monooxygenase [Thermotogota bacterium]|nr:FAD-dependent monooxygenase [Thermotogota bacterium]